VRRSEIAFAAVGRERGGSSCWAGLTVIHRVRRDLD
jgi:hypothetical protein